MSILAASVKSQDSLWAANFGPTGVYGTVKTIESWGDSLVIGGQILGLPHSTFTAHNFVFFDLIDRSWHRPHLGPEGSGDEVRAVAEGPDGSLFIGGDFTFNVADTIFDNIAMLDKNGQWKTLMGGLNDGIDGPVNALLWHEGKLYIGGEFTSIDGQLSTAFAIWDPDTGFESPQGLLEGMAEKVVIHDFAVSTAHGNHIYLGGDFVIEGDTAISISVGRFDVDDSQFKTVIGFPFGVVYTIHTEDSEEWQDRYVIGGEFTEFILDVQQGGPYSCSNIAVCNFIDSTVEVPAIGTNGPVYVVKPHSSNMSQLLVGGEFDSANGEHTGPLARWTPSSDSWSRYNPNIHDDDAVYAISDYINARYTIGGDFKYIDDSALVNSLVQIHPLTPTNWWPMGDGLINDDGKTSIVADVASGGYQAWYAVGSFNIAGGRRVNYVAKWDDEQWSSLGGGVDNFLQEVAVTEDTVYVYGSQMTSAGGVPVNKIAMWDGSQWHALGNGLPDGFIYEMELDSSGNLYVCGSSLDTAGTTPVTGIAKWNGSNWEAMGELGWSTNTGRVRDIYIDPETQDVYICGDFVTADGNPCNKVARWDGNSWFPLGDDHIGDGNPYVIGRAPNGRIVVTGFLDRPELRQMITPGSWEGYAGGVAVPSVTDMLTVGCDFFMSGDPLQVVGSEDNFVNVDNIARWDGDEWIDLAGGELVGGDVNSIAAYGSNLAMGGRFRIAAGKLANGFTLWKGLRNTSNSIGLFVTPNYDDTLIAGEIYEIAWNTSGTTAEEISLEISYDSGITWQTIASNIDGQQGKIPWLVPDNPTIDCRLRISDTYASCANKVSWPFHIIDGPTEDVNWLRRFSGPFYQEPFTVGYHSWPFGNTGANCWPDSVARNYPYPDWFRDSDLPDTLENFPPWSLFVAAFGDDWCYRNGDPGRVRPRAMERWKNMLTDWGGSCLGFSNSALLWWKHNEFNTNLDLPDNLLVTFDIGTFARNAVNKHWIYQNGEKHVDYNREVKDFTPMQTLAAIREGFATGDPRSLSFSWKSWKDKTDTAGNKVDSVLKTNGHNVVPYAIKTFTDTTGIYHMYVYDSNRPNNNSRYARIDSINSTWTFEAYDIYDTTGRFVPRLPVSEYMGLATDERKNKSIENNLESGAMLFASSTEEILISDSNGHQVGYINGEPINTIPDAFPIIPDDPDREYGYPDAYYLPEGDYRIELSEFERAQTRIAFETDDAVYVYERKDANTDETDMLSVGDGLDIVNSENKVKNVSVTGISSVGDIERFVRIDGLQYAPNDSTSLEFDSTGTIQIRNYGQSKNYSLLLWYSDPDMDSYTQSPTTIPLAANSTHELDPPWSGLEDSSMYIRIDEDQDGIVDDSIMVDIITDIDDESGQGVLPRDYILGQNYPNPFNPSTTIDFTLPVRSHVTIDVLNILGQKVTNLLDEVRPAGTHSVTWNGRDGGNQTVAAGIYFYRLQVDDRSLTKKMLLLK